MTGIRGTNLRVAAYDRNANTEVLTGRVETTTPLGAVQVAQGFGTRANAGRPPDPPRLLLPAPGLETLPALVEAPVSDLPFAAVPGAARYRSIVATDARFENAVAEAVSDAPRMRTTALADGEYFFRARAIDPVGLEGHNAEGRFRVKANPPPPRVPNPAPAGTLTQAGQMDLVFEWEAVADASRGYHLQIASDAQFSRDLSQFDSTGTRLVLGFATAPVRNVYWRVRSIDAAGSPGPYGPVQAFVMGARKGRAKVG